MFAYFYGNMSPMMVRRSQQDFYYREYTIVYESGQCFTQADAAALLADPLIEKVSVYARIESEGRLDFLVADLENSPSIVLIRGENSLGSVPDGIIIPYDHSAPLGGSVMLVQQPFRVIAQHTLSDYYIPYSRFLSLQQPIVRMVVTTAQRQDLRHDAVVDMLNSRFSNLSICTPRLYEKQDSHDSVSAILLICAVYALSMISFAFLLQHLMDSNVGHTVICRIVGASSRDIFSLTLLEGVVLCVLVDGAGLLLHRLLYRPLFSNINLSRDIVYTYGDYLLIFCLMLAVGLAVLIPFIWKYARLSPTSARRAADA